MTKAAPKSPTIEKAESATLEPQPSFFSAGSSGSSSSSSESVGFSVLSSFALSVASVGLSVFVFGTSGVGALGSFSSALALLLFSALTLQLISYVIITQICK